MTLQQLLYIVETANEGSFFKAADKCFVTQPTLSIQIKKLEDELGVQIFDRDKKPLRITPEGELIISKAKSIVDEINTLNSYAKKEHLSLTGQFKIGIIPTLATSILPIFIKNFNKKLPDTEFILQELHTKSIISSLMTGEIDIGILVTPLNEKKLREIPLFNEKFFIYTSKSHSLYRLNNIKLNDLTEDGLMILEEGHCFRNQTLEICNLSKIKDNKIKYQSGSIDTLMKIIDINYGYTLVPELSVINSNNDMIREFVPPVPVREVSLVVKNTFTKEKLLQTIREEILSEIPSNVKKIEKYFRVNI